MGNELTTKEKNYIISELICTTDSVNLSKKDFIIDNFEDAKFEDFDIDDKSEFELIKSIIRKLNKTSQNRSNKKQTK